MPAVAPARSSGPMDVPECLAGGALVGWASSPRGVEMSMTVCSPQTPRLLSTTAATPAAAGRGGWAGGPSPRGTPMGSGVMASTASQKVPSIDTGPARKRWPDQCRTRARSATVATSAAPARIRMPAALVAGRALRVPAGWASGPPFPHLLQPALQRLWEAAGGSGASTRSSRVRRLVGLTPTRRGRRSPSNRGRPSARMPSSGLPQACPEGATSG